MQLLLINSKKTKEEYKISLKEKSKKILRKIKKNKLKYLIRKKKVRHLQTANQNCFVPKDLAEKTQLENNLAIFLGAYSDTKQTDQLYQGYITSTPDQYKFQFHNKLSAKIQSYQLIDTDQATNFEFSPNQFTKVAVTFLNLIYTLPVPMAGLIAGTGQFALKTVSDKRKVNKTKNKLAHCIPGENFIKLITILLTKFHETDFLNQENSNSFSEKKFQEFWSVFKKQAKANPNTENLIQFWSKCLFEYFEQQTSTSAFSSDHTTTPIATCSAAQALNTQATRTQYKAGFFKSNSAGPIVVEQPSFASPAPTA